MVLPCDASVFFGESVRRALRFLGRLAFDVVGVNVDRDVEIAKVLLNQRSYFSPIKTTDASGQPRQGQALDFAFGDFMVQATQGVVDMCIRCFAWLGTVGVLAILRQQVDDAATVGGAPNPDLAWLWMGCMGVVPKVFGQRRPHFTQGKSKATIPWVVRGNAMGDGLSF